MKLSSSSSRLLLILFTSYYWPAVVSNPSNSPTTMSTSPSPVPISSSLTAAPTGNDNTQCDDFVYPNMTEPPIDVCYKAELFGLGEGRWRALNGTILTDLLPFRNEYTIYDHETFEPMYFIIIKRSGPNSTDTIEVKGLSKCSKFTYCGADRYTADCRNFQFGRLAICEPAFPLFFPFRGPAAEQPIVLSPTRAPVPKPTQRPTNTPSSRPTTKPTIQPTVQPISNITTKVVPLFALLNNTKCVNFTFPNMTRGKPINVCFKAELYGLGNGQWKTMNGSIFTNPTPFNNEYTIYNHQTYSPLYTIAINRTFDRVNYIGVNGIGRCRKFSYCGNDRYSADCRNLRFGRNATCEPAFPVFFPFRAGADLTVVNVNPTQAPVPKPTRKPAYKPTLKPLIQAPIQSLLQ
jgi:hypothetical protein